jgi:hypothetical protein
MMLAQPSNQVQTGSRKVAATPARSVPAPRPPPRAPPAPPRPAPPPSGNNDTMIDGESPLTADPALAAAVAKAKANMGADAGEGRTEFLGTGNRPPPPPPRKGPSAPPPKPRGPQPEEGVGATLQVGPEAAAAAKRDALAKAAQVSHAKPQQPSFLSTLSKNRKMQLIVGGACALALIIIIFAVIALFSDGSSEKEKKKGKPKTAAVVETSEDSSDKPDKAEKKDSYEAKTEKAPEKAEQDTSRPPPDAEVKPKQAKQAKQAKEPKEEKAAAPAKALGTLIVNAAGAPVAWDGGAPKPGAQRISVNDKIGIVTVGDASTPFKVELEWAVDGSALVFKVRSTPWAIVSLDQVSRGKTPLSDVRIEKKLTLVELKKPGQPNPMAIRLRYDGN